jgi:hypothetical protein
MEAASRPPLELLPDLPVEEPVDAARSPPQAATAPAAAAAATPGGAAVPQARDPEQTGLNFIDPEMFLAAGQSPSSIPVLNASAAPAAASPPPDSGELTLEDPVVDDLLTGTPPAPKPAPPPPAASASESQSKESARAQNTARESARVPIAKTASLSRAATKVAAAAQRAPAKAAPAPAPKVSAAPIKPAPAAPPVVPAATAPAASSAPHAETPGAAKADAPAAKLEAPSLASWQSARASAPNAAKPAAPPATSAAAPRPAPSPAAPPAPAAAQTAAPGNILPPSPAMDRDFIARNQVVERYITGRLPVKGATEFERFCKEHPELLDEIGLPERVNAGLRLLEAAGKPEPWQEPARATWDRPQVTLSLAAGVVILLIAVGLLGANSAGKSRRLVDLQKQATERALDPATSTREIRLMPSRSGASNSAAIVIGGPNAQLAEFKIDESRSPYHTFRITIDRIDQGRVAIISNLNKDSNGHLRLALNSSALGPGNYQFTLEGLDWRGEPQPDSWVTIGIAH